MMRFRFSTHVAVNGLNLDRALSLLEKANVELRNIRRVHHRRLEFDVPSGQKMQIVALLRAKCYNDIEIQETGFPRFFTKRGLPLVVSAVLFFSLLFFCSTFVLKTEIVGNVTLSEQEISRQLTELHANVGSRKSGISLDELENALCTRLPQLNFVRAELRGSTLLLTLYEKVVVAPPADFRKRQDVCAERDGIVSDLYVVRGTPLVKAGDRVKKGQILIAGYRTFPDGSTADVKAEGEVFAEVTVTGSDTFETEQIVHRRTGNKTSLTNLSFFGTHVDSKRRIPYAGYETETVYRFFTTLPIRFECVTVYETKPEKIHRAYDDAESAFARQRALENARGNLCFQEQNVDYNVRVYDTCVVTEAILKGRVRIGA